MKKILFCSFALLLFCSCATLKLAYSSNEDGNRILTTSDVGLFSSQFYNFDIAMGAKVSPQDTVLAILVTCDKNTDHGIFDKGNRFMIKLESGENISLSNVYDKEFEEDSKVVNTTDRIQSYGYEYFYSPYDDAVFVSPYEVTSLVPRTYVRKTHKSYALYLISKKQVLDVSQNRVTKLRIETEDNEFDMPSPEHTSVVFSDLYSFLYPIIKAGVVRSEF